jgi:ribosomal protein L29
MKSSEIKGKDQKTLADMLKTKRDALRAFTFSTAGSKSRNVKEGHNLKKDIARILTEVNTTK